MTDTPKPSTSSKPASKGAAPGKPVDSRTDSLGDSAPAKLPDPVDISRAVAQIAERSQRIVQEFLARQANETPNADPFNISGAFVEMTTKLFSDPTRLMRAQVSLWNDYLRLWQRTAERFFGGAHAEEAASSAPVIATPRGDKRFQDPAWQENALFDFIKQSYLLTARFMQGAASEVEGLDEKSMRKIDFYTRQFVDALAPSNFIMTNPTVLRETIDTNGENLVKGLTNMLDDLERGNGRLSIRMTDPSSFKLGETIATTPGKVVFQNELMQLIQFEPTTETVRKRPLLVIPAWINKYYILDLKPKNSFVRWAVAQGHTVFIISWVNPDENLGQKGFEDYMTDGPLAALDAIKDLTGEAEVNAVGYCIGGTLLSTTLAYMAAKGDERIKSATFLTTMVDFAEAGELSVFIDEEQLQALESRMRERGYLEGAEMSATFNMLRANDLIWSFVVNNYLLGKEPFPFDLLYWNSDATRLPYAMHSFYLRNMYQENKLVQPGGVCLKDVPIDLTRIKTPVFLLSTQEDHIAPWKSTYAATKLYAGPVRFCLAGSGHIAGVINPPENNKYSYWLNAKLPKTPEQWLEGAEQHAGSWWQAWDKWVARHGGAQIPARDIKKSLQPAPGSYVMKRGK